VTTFEEIQHAVETWTLSSIVSVLDLKGKAAIVFDGQTKVYPYWLALQKVNQIGAEHGV